jgi:cell division protein FtsL
MAISMRPFIALARSGADKAKRLEKSPPAAITPVLLSVLFVAPVVAAGIFYVWSQVAAVRLGYEMSTASERHRALLEENRALRIEVASLRAPERLQQLAQQYRLAPPRSEQIVRLEKERK